VRCDASHFQPDVDMDQILMLILVAGTANDQQVRRIFSGTMSKRGRRIRPLDVNSGSSRAWIPYEEEIDMKYLALIYAAPGADPDYDTPEFEPFMEGYRTATETYQRDGVMLAGEALEPTSTATTVRVRNGKTETMDGPFAETKEQLGGFYLFECANLDDAIRYAAMIPSAKNGSVEVRPVMEIE
jgi:hypothetical protein